MDKLIHKCRFPGVFSPDFVAATRCAGGSTPMRGLLKESVAVQAPVFPSNRGMDSTDHHQKRVGASSAIRRASFVKQLARHFRCILVLILGLASRTGIPLAIFGLLNSRFRVVRSVFFCYAGNARYANHYRYSWASNLLRWHPTPIGLFRQGGVWGLVCASPVTEREFTDPANREHLRLLVARMSRFRRLMAAEHVSFAGILPTVLKRQELEPVDGSPFDRTGEVVAAAIRNVQSLHFKNIDHDVVLLGGSGRVGRQVHTVLAKAGINAMIIDPAANSASAKLRDLHKRPALIVDVSRRGALEACLVEIPHNAVVLNEVFPEPLDSARKALKAKGSILYHLAGVAAGVYPSLPLGYGNAVPCCAMHSENGIVPVLQRLA